MNRLLCFLACVLLVSPTQGVHAQNETTEADGRVTGRVVAANGAEPLPGATIALRNPSDSTLVTGKATNNAGEFDIENLPYGAYTFEISFVGYVTKRVTDVRLVRSRPQRELGTITLAQKTEQLQEVTVSAQRPAMEVRPDRTIYNTNQQIVTAGGTARAVLNELPSIYMDMDGSISYRGSEDVSVYINGDPSSLSGQSLTNFLQSLSASAVERVEVISNPSARFDPEGSAGIINIVLRRNRSAGWSGGVTLGGGTNGSYTGSGNLGYQDGPLRLFGNYGYRHGSRDQGGSRFRRNRTTAPTVLLNQSSTSSDENHSHTLNTQAEYRATEEMTLTLETVLSTDSDLQNERTNYIRETVDGTLLDRYARLGDDDGNERSMDIGLSIEQNWGPEHSLEGEFEYERGSQSENSRYTERSLSADRELGDVLERERENSDRESARPPSSWTTSGRFRT